MACCDAAGSVGCQPWTFFSPERRGKGFHDIDIQSTTWTINTEDLGLLHSRRFTKQHLKSARSFPGCIPLLAYHCQVDYIFAFLYLNPILMFYYCSYNVSAHMADVVLHVELRQR